jgi:glucose-1-phosphate adenylyltransferase
MDYREMIDFHIRKKADLTIATMQEDRQYSKDFGVVETTKTGQVKGFQEKPVKPATVPGKPDSILINMGVYIFNTDVLVKRLIENARKPDTQHDFGKNVIPSMLKTDRVFAWSFTDEKTGRSGYWRDVGTIEAYYDANMDLLDEKPQSNLFDSSWPIFTSEKQAAQAKVCGFEQKDGQLYGVLLDSIISRGCLINRAHIEHSILSPNIRVGQYSEIYDSILLDNVTIGKNCKIRRAIIDKGVKLSDGTEIGFNLKKDAQKGTVSDTGIVVIPKNTVY